MRFLIFFIAFLSSTSVYSQTELDIPTELDLLNKYVEVYNDQIYILWDYYNQFNDFNKTLLEVSPEIDAGVKIKLEFMHKEILDDPTYFGENTPRAKLFYLENKDGYIRSNYLANIKGLSRQMWENTLEIVRISEDLDQYIKRKVYLKDPQQKQAFDLLEESAEFYQNAFRLSLEMSSTIERAFVQMKKKDQFNPYNETGEILRNLVQPCQAIILALKKENKTDISNLLLELEMAMEIFKEHAGDDLTNVRFLEESSKKLLFIRYDFIWQQVNQFRDFVDEYIKDEGYKLPHGNAYFYYNKRLLSKYNRFGRGIISQHNRFIDSTHVEMIKIVEIPNWLKTVRPEDIEKAEEVLAQMVPKKDTIVKKSSPLDGFAKNNLVFLIDVSTSMNKPEKIELLVQSFKHLVRLMRPEDEVAIVTYSGSAKLVLSPISSKKKNQIFMALDSLKPKGKSDILEGFTLASKTAGMNFIPNGNNKIIIATDGAYENEKALSKIVKETAKDNIQLSVLYYSKKVNPEDQNRLLKLAKMGKGNFRHIQQNNSNESMLLEAQKVRE